MPDCAIAVVVGIAEAASAPAKPRCNNVLLAVKIRSAIVIACPPYGLVMKSCWNYGMVAVILNLHINGIRNENVSLLNKKKTISL
jgi:hypothetical protein